MSRAWPVFVAPPATCALLGLIGYHPTVMLAGAAGVRAMVLGQGTILAILLITAVPAVRQIPLAQPAERFRLGLKAAGLRFGLTVLLAGVVIWRSPVPPVALLLWMAITYAVAVQVETICLVRWMKGLEHT